jgi:hypothetical protein
MEHLEVLPSHLAKGRRLYELCADEQGGLRWRQVATQDIQPFQVPHSPSRDGHERSCLAERELLFRFDGDFDSVLPGIPAQTLFGVLSLAPQSIAYRRLFTGDQHYQTLRQVALSLAINCLPRSVHGFCAALSCCPQVCRSGAVLAMLPLKRRGYALLVSFKTGSRPPKGLSLDQGEDWCVEGTSSELLADDVMALDHDLIEKQAGEAIALGFVECEGWGAQRVLRRISRL